MPSACPDRDRDELRDDALDLLPAEVWERVFASVSLRTAVRMAAACKSLWVLSQRKFIVNRRYESIFGRALASEDERAERTMMMSYLSSERWLEDAHLGETVFPKPVHFSVGPSFVRGLLADETTVTSFDREKVKIWYHGAGIRGDDDAGGRLASLFVEKKEFGHSWIDRVSDKPNEHRRRRRWRSTPHLAQRHARVRTATSARDSKR